MLKFGSKCKLFLKGDSFISVYAFPAAEPMVLPLLTLCEFILRNSENFVFLKLCSLHAKKM